eukprot:jgi/Orpsp1_1/1179652/evm.model.c7180000070203.1
MDKLSGGQKRKLCIGLALVGNPKYIFLDEPTTSLDPLSRRKIWDILLKIKKDRVIILCTHYMDEADILADRKMIITQGRIRCLGSSVYLKNHFNMKYMLNVETKMKFKDEIEKIILNYIPEAKYSKNSQHQYQYQYQEKEMIQDSNSQFIKENVNNDHNDQISCYTWTLPMSQTNNYYQLFRELELLKGEKLNQISLDSPYLEDLFIRLTLENFEKKSNLDDSESSSNLDISVNSENEELPRLNEISKISFISKTLRFIKYRFILLLKDRVFLLVYLIVPIILIGILVFMLKDHINESKVIKFNEKDVSTSKIYDGNQWNYAINDSNMNNTLTREIIEKTLLSSTNVKTTPISYYSTEEMEGIGKEPRDVPYYVSSFDANLSNSTYLFDIYYNDSMPHALPVTINTLSNSLLSLNEIQENIVAHSQPYNFNDRLSFFEDGKTLVLLMSLCISFVVSFFGPMTIQEKKKQLLKQLYLSGITNKSYWCATFIEHFILLYALTIIIIGVCAIIGLEVFKNIMNITIILILLILCCISTVVFQYFIRFGFNEDIISYLLYVLINFIPMILTINNILENELLSEIVSTEEVFDYKSEIYKLF